MSNIRRLNATIEKIENIKLKIITERSVEIENHPSKKNKTERVS